MAINIITWLLLSALASFRLAEMFIIDAGPFDIFMNFRGWDLSSNPIKKLIGGIFKCVHCAGVYTSCFFALLFFFQNFFTIGLLLVFAVAGLQSLLAGRFGRIG